MLNHYPQLSSAYNHVYYFPEIDSKNKTFNNATLPSVLYVSGENNLIMAEESITVESCDFMPNNESVSFKAGKEILFSGEIEINYGFEMDARNGNIEKTCTVIQVPQQRTSSNNSSENTQLESDQSKNIFLQFKIIKENDFAIQIFPQPANDYLRYTIDQIPNSTNKTFEIKIHDMLGKELYSGISRANSDIISLYAIAPGFYFIQFKFDDLNANTIKFIKL